MTDLDQRRQRVERDSPGARSLDDRWSAAIRDAGGFVDPDETPARAHIAGCVLEVGFVRNASPPVTWLAADAPGAAGLRLAVSRSGSHPFRDAFPIETGDAAFDQEFTVQTNDAPFARLWLDEAVRARIAAGKGYHFLIENGRSRAWRFDAKPRPAGEASDAYHEVEHERRVSALRALVALSQRGRVLEESWRDLAGHLGGRLVTLPASERSRGVISMEIALNHESVVIDGFFGGLAPRRPGRGLFTRVRVPRRSESRDSYVIHDAAGRRQLRPRLPMELQALALNHPEFSARYQVECERPDLVRDRLDDAMCQHILDATPSVVFAERELLTVIFLGFENDIERLRAGITLAEKLALEIPPMGLASPYR